MDSARLDCQSIRIETVQGSWGEQFPVAREPAWRQQLAAVGR